MKTVTTSASNYRRIFRLSQLSFLSLLLIHLHFESILAVAEPNLVTSLNACNLDNDFMFCSCNSMEPHEAEEITCQVYGPSNPSREQWLAVSDLINARVLQLTIRPPRKLNYSVPEVVFTKLRHLNYFKVKMGEMHTLPAWAFSNSSSLSEIVLEDNMISKLSTFSFAYMANLTKLDLGQNNILEIQRKTFVHLPVIKSLLLSQNGMQIIHDQAFKDLKSLEELELWKNNLSVIVRDVFYGLSSLKRLDLRHNKIELLGDHVFAELTSLEDLDLQKNQIVSISPTAFQGLKEMHRLNLQNNKVVEFLPETFHHFPKIHFLDLRNNRLETFSKTIIGPTYFNFMNFTSMQFMLEGNHLKCDCGILWLQRLWIDTISANIRTHLNETECFHIPKVYPLRRDEAIKKNIPVILVDEDENESSLGTEIIPQMISVMSLSPEDYNCPPDEPSTVKPPRKGGKKGNKENKGKNKITESEVVEDKSLAHHLHNPEGRTESSSQSHQANNIINVPGLGSKVEFLMNKWVVLAFILFLQ